MTVIESILVFWVNQHSEEIEVVFAEVPPTEEPQPPSDDFYDGCDVTKTCFGIGDGDCVANRRCVTIGAVKHDEGKFTFEMRGSSKSF